MPDTNIPIPEQEQCILHLPSIKLDTNEKLIELQNYKSWQTLLEAAQVRHYEPVLELCTTLSDSDFPHIFYHKTCRSIFTMKKLLDSFKRKAGEYMTEAAEDGESSTSKRPKRGEKPYSTLLETLCIFCEKNKYGKGTNTREKLIKAAQLRVDETLRKFATERGDANILALVCRDMVAAEANYHRSCYRNYTRTTTTSCEELHTPEDCFDDYSEVERDSYDDLLKFIRNSILPNKQIVPMKSLADKLQSIMKSKGIQQVKDSTKKHIKRNLIKHLGMCLNIYPDNKGKLLVVPDTVTVKSIVIENERLKAELEVWKSKSNVNDLIDLTSTHLRNQIKNDVKESPWPCHPSDVDSQSFHVPDYLQRFFLGLLTGDVKKENYSERVNMLVQSFSHDFIYAVTGGHQKTPKHVLLSYAVKTLTGNVELIHTLNRLGHGISYSQLEENDTALCIEKLSSGSTEQAVIPRNIQPYIFTNLAWDNIDRLEETLTGKGTSHRVNGIAVQANVFGPHLPRAAVASVKKTKQRTIAVRHSEPSVYIAGERKGPHLSLTTLVPPMLACMFKKEERKSQGKNLVWIVTRHEKESEEIQTVPSWTGFNIKTRDSLAVSQDNIGYLPTINAPATELSTVCEILNQSDTIRKDLQLASIIVVMDQALYAKASEIIWKHPNQYCNIILRMGVFHTICNFISILGKRFEDAGLRDICIESGILGEGSLSGVFSGKMYNRAIRVHKCIYEAFMRLVWECFLSWVDSNESETVTFILNDIKELRDDLTKCNIDKILQSQGFEAILELWNRFLNYLRHDNGDLSTFWMSYIDMVERILLNLLRASREGNWILHLFAIRSMIPWCFAYDKFNYARYLPVYYAQMSQLKEENPEVHDHFMNGHFSVQMSDTNTFGRIPIDQATEVTINKDTQTPGGTSRFSLKPGAVKKYYITAEFRSGFLHHMRQFVQSCDSRSSHADLLTTRMKKDENAVLSVINIIKNWINPFAQELELLCISTGKEAIPSVKTDLMHALKEGENKYEKFKTDRLEKIPPATKFHDRITLSKLGTFSSMCKKTAVKLSGKTIILKADRTLFGRIIIASQARKLKMQDVMSYSLGPLPWPLATPDGQLRKTNKSSLAISLQKDVPTAEYMPLHSATIIDGMHLVHKLKGHQTTFGEVAMDLFSMILHEGSESQRIDVVFDRYQEISIKNSERQMRGSDTGIKVSNITAAQIIRQWRHFLKLMSNKTNLISFLVTQWKTPEYSARLKNKILFVTCAEKCYKITNDSTQEIHELSSTHEEADGRLLLHAHHAAKEGYKAVLISSVDTDVFILCLAFQKFIKAPLFQKCGSKNRTRLLDIERIVTHVGQDVCDALIGLHAFTGCDTVSTFAGKGKVTALKMIIREGVHNNTFSKLGSEWDLPEKLINQLERFTCCLYSPKLSATNINALRYNLFCAKKGEIESHLLPPCLDCLKKHAERANYQAAIWKQSLQADPGTPTPIGRGWKLIEEDGKEQLTIDWMDGLPAPQAVLDLLACKCSKICELPKCICMANGMNCTDMCRLLDCSNQGTIDSIDDESELCDEFDFYGFE